MGLIEVSNVTKYFGGLRALNDISFTLKAGEIPGLIRPNGAGKTTLFNIIASTFPLRHTPEFDNEGITLVGPAALRHELDAIRTGAVAYSREEHTEGIVAMALVVFGFDGQVAGSIVVPIPSIRFNRQREKVIELGLRDLALQISHQLGFIDCFNGRLVAGKKRNATVLKRGGGDASLTFQTTRVHRRREWLSKGK